MRNSIDGDGIKAWVKSQVRQARIERARKAVEGTKLAEQLPDMSDAMLLEIARNLENPKQLMANLLVVHNYGRRRHHIQRFR